MSGDGWFYLLMVVVVGVLLVRLATVAVRPLPPGSLPADRSRQVRRQQGTPFVATVELFLAAHWLLSLRTR